MEHRRVKTNGVELHVVTEGDPDAPLVLLLHGFPEFWFAWKQYLSPLADAGFFVAAPDQRGYNTSDKPPAVSDYAIDTLALDVVGLIDAFEKERAFVVGHDWGAAAAWWTAMRHPERVERLAVLNVPHPLVMRRFMFRHPSQLKKSWYMFFFQLPILPEKAFTRDDGARMFRGMKEMGRPGAFDDEDEDVYRKAWRQPGAVTGMLNWYRAAFSMLATRFDGSTSIDPETLILWGKRDALLDRRMAEESLAKCRSARLELFDDATHWVNHEEVEGVTGALVEFLKKGGL